MPETKSAMGTPRQAPTMLRDRSLGTHRCLIMALPATPSKRRTSSIASDQQKKNKQTEEREGKKAEEKANKTRQEKENKEK